MVQAEESLWDMRCASYHDRNRKRRVIEELSEKLELPGKYVRTIDSRNNSIRSSSITGLCRLSSHSVKNLNTRYNILKGSSMLDLAIYHCFPSL